MTKENLIYKLSLHVEDGDIASFSVYQHIILISGIEVSWIYLDQDLKEQYYNIFKEQL